MFFHFGGLQEKCYLEGRKVCYLNYHQFELLISFITKETIIKFITKVKKKLNLYF